METLKIISGISLIIIFISLASAAPPGLPVLIYGKIVDKDNDVIPGQDVKVTWTDKKGQIQTTTTSTLTNLEAELLGYPEVTGFYRFEISAIENSIIIIKSGDESFEINAVSGIPIEIPTLAVGTSAIISDKKSFIKDITDYIGSFFKKNESEQNEVNDNLGGSDNVDADNTDSSGGSIESSSDDSEIGSEEGGEDFSGEGSDTGTFNNNDNQSNGEFSQDDFQSYEEGYDEIAQSHDSSLEDAGSDDGLHEPGETSVREDTDVESEDYDQKLKDFEKISNKTRRESYKVTIAPITDVFMSSARFLEKYTSSKGFILDIIIISIIIGLVIMYFAVKIFKKFHTIKPDESLKFSIKKIDRLNSKVIMDKKLKALSSENSLLDVIELFTSNNLNIIPIISSSGRPLGIITKKILLSKISDHNLKFLESTKIKTIMQKKFIKCNPDVKLRELYDLMLKKNSSEIIIEDDGILLGTVDFFNILNILDNVNFEIKNPPTLNRCISKNVVFINYKSSLLKLKDLLIQKNSNYAIVEKQGKPLGIITSKDLINAVKKGLDLQNDYVQNIMSSNILVITPGTSVYEAVSIMLDRGFNQVPVVMNEKVVGVVNIKNLVSFYYDFILELKSSNRNISFDKDDWSKRIKT